MLPTRTYLLGLAAAVYVTTCLVVAAVRWFHMCRPYNHNPRYYYPGRPYVTASWLSSLALLPYVLNPESADAWFLARLYFLPVTLYHFALILLSYFGSVMQWKKWQRPTLAVGVPVVLALLVAVVLAVWPGEQLEWATAGRIALYVLGAPLTAVCFISIRLVFNLARRFDVDDFSNPADFPVTQAQRWLVLVLGNSALCWTGALANSPVVMAIIQLLISVSSVVFLLTVLHPNRRRPYEDPADAADSSTQLYKRPISKKKQAEMLAAVRTVVEQQEAFLDPHLTLQDVADRCGYNRTYISGLIKNELGGFSTYVNRRRLAYLDEYLQENPGATLSEAIDAAGFGSHATYYALRKRLEETP